MTTSHIACSLWLILACSACTQVNGISLGSASLPSDETRDSGMRGTDAAVRDGGHHDDDDDDDDHDDDDLPGRDGDDRSDLIDDNSGHNSFRSTIASDAGAAVDEAGDGLADASSATDDVDGEVEPKEP